MRDQLLAALREVLEAAEAADDVAMVLRPEATSVARRLAEVAAADDLDASYQLGWFHYYRSVAIYREDSSGESSDQLMAAAREAHAALLPCYLAGVDTMPPALLGYLALAASDAAVSQLGRALAGSEPPDEASVALWRRIVRDEPADHANRPGHLANLAVALKLRCERSGQAGELDEAIGLGREAVAVAGPGHPQLALFRSNLAGVLRLRFERTWAVADLDEAVDIARAALREAAADDPERPVFLAHLAGVLRVRFEWSGEPADLDEAVELARAAVRDVPLDHPRRDICLADLNAAMQTRFDRFGSSADLDEAVAAARSAVETTPEGHPYRGMYLSMLGVALRVRFERTGDRTGAEEALERSRAAVRATPAGNHNRTLYLSNLGLAAYRHFGQTGAIADLDESIDSFRAALDEGGPGSASRAIALSNLSLVFRVRFDATGAPADLDESISSAREAVEAAPAGDARLASYLAILAVGLVQRSGSAADLDDAMAAALAASRVTSAQPTVRIWAAWIVGSVAARMDRARAAELLESAVRLLPETAPRRLDRTDQERMLAPLSGIAGDAAALALADDTAPPGEAAAHALRLLELGRGVLLSQALDTRSDLADLHAAHPELAARFVALRDRFDAQPAAVGDPSSALLTDGPTGDRAHLATAFEAVLAEIRGTEGFRTFLLPPGPKQLMHAAREGPVVVVNVSWYRCDAILVRPAGIASVTLPRLNGEELPDRLAAFRRAVGIAHDSVVGGVERRAAQHAIDQVLEWLWDAVAEPILDALGHRAPPPNGAEWPRLWWVPTGLLGLLPLHAAGYHRDGSGRTVMDRVVSSYSPTVRALGYARERANQPGPEDRTLIVAMSSTPGYHSLHYVEEEARVVQAHLPESRLLSHSGDSGDHGLPTRSAVLTWLDGSAIAHFACHGIAHPTDPSRSMLLLSDHKTDPLTVASLAAKRLDGARLAYLSACHTAAGPEAGLVDEAIHLVTAFQLLGYPRVVGTLWQIDDAFAVQVADEFYAGLRTHRGSIDTARSGWALHRVVRALRDELPRTPSLWAAYLHVGA